jgi:hypothetical protein
MSEVPDVPVALFVFARPDLLTKVLAAVRTARPRLLLVVADGPRKTHPQDIANCAATLELIESVDWKCEIRYCVAEQNLGCDARLTTGLDWVFGRVPEAIILEDDLVPDPSFFPWCAAMLRRYRDEPKIMHVSGRNELGRWGSDSSDHLIVRRGSISGWGAWRRAWFGVDREFCANEAVHNALDRLDCEPLLAADLDILLNLATSGHIHAWDITWDLGKALAGGLSVIPPVNLVANVGFDARATRTVDETDLRGTIPSGAITPLAACQDKSIPEIDPTYDRWSLLLLLMATYRNPALARRLARFPKVTSDSRLESARQIAHHLAPFANPEESIAVLEHLNSIGIVTPRIAAIQAELRAELEHRRNPSNV